MEGVLGATTEASRKSVPVNTARITSLAKRVTVLRGFLAGGWQMLSGKGPDKYIDFAAAQCLYPHSFVFFWDSCLFFYQPSKVFSQTTEENYSVLQKCVIPCSMLPLVEHFSN